MSITLTEKNIDELLDENALYATHLSSEPWELLVEVPKCLGKGYVRDIEVYPNVSLKIYDFEYHDDLFLQLPLAEHPLQFAVLLSGKVKSSYGCLDKRCAMISGSGMQNYMICEFAKFQHILGVDIDMPPQLLSNFFPGENGEILPQLKMLVKDKDWQTLICPESTVAMQGVVQQIINCPLLGLAKRMYLQAKVMELIALLISPFLADSEKQQSSPRLKPETTARIYYARDILRSRLENPPSSLELAQIVGLSDRTLRYGFKQLFGTTVFGYLTNERMKLAEKLLRQGENTVATVANQLGYCHQGRFAATFKSKFGITPSQCLLGKNSVSEP
jgi:AraC-like DNA-binding protein